MRISAEKLVNSGQGNGHNDGWLQATAGNIVKNINFGHFGACMGIFD
jgi:hypothetical protein